MALSEARQRVKLETRIQILVQARIVLFKSVSMTSDGQSENQMFFKKENFTGEQMNLTQYNWFPRPLGKPKLW